MVTLFVVTLGIFPAYGEREAEIDYFLVDQRTGERYFVEKDVLKRSVFLGWIFLPGLLFVPIIPNVSLEGDSHSEMAAASKEAAEKNQTGILRSETAHSLIESLEDSRRSIESRFQRMKENGTSWQELRQLLRVADSHELRPAVAQRLDEACDQWLRTEVSRRFEIEADLPISWENGRHWGPLWRMFRRVLPISPNDGEFEASMPHVSRCPGADHLNATHCYWLIPGKDQKAVWILLQKRKKSLTIVGLGTGATINPAGWEALAKETLEAVASAPTNWFAVTNPELLRFRIQPW